MRLSPLAAVALLAFASSAWSQTARVAPPVPGRGAQAALRAAAAPYIPTAGQLVQINARLDLLNAAIADLKRAKADDDLVVDAEAYAWTVNNVVRVPGAFIDQTYVNKCLTVLSDGLRRAEQIKLGRAEWPKLTGSFHRAYRSVVDGTAQPYQITIPSSYDPSKPTPLYVYLHGRSQFDPDMGLGEVGGNDQPRGGGGGGGGQSYIRVNAFGRANNSYRWAGETDIYEVIASVEKRYNIDPDRIILAGFSLGGAGSWQIGLHHPDMFCGLEVDAGVIGNRLTMTGLSPSEKAAQSTYGIMIDHALNVWNVPLVAYAGANDAQLLSSTNIRKQLVQEGYTIDQLSTYVGKGRDINALFLATPGQGHSHASGETQRLIDDFNDANFKRGRVVPDHVRYITYTTRYNTDYWVAIDGLQHHFDRASVDAVRDVGKTIYTIKTSNVSALRLGDMSGAGAITIDGQSLSFSNRNELSFVCDNGRWLEHVDNTVRVSKAKGHESKVAPAVILRKVHGLQGPINDAFMDAFLCVSPGSRGFSPAADERAAQELDRFSKMFTRDFLGDARTKPDSAITAADIANNNLILFGDPASNSVIARVAGSLPIKWTKDAIVVGSKTYTAADHIPVLIYPNPLNRSRYIVINTGLVTGGFNQGSGYGDYAILNLAKSAAPIADGGVFDESWQLPATR